MAPPEYRTFDEVFVSRWPNEGADEDSDFVDNDPGDDQSDLSIDEGSITSGDRKVIAKGSAAGSDDEETTPVMRELPLSVTRRPLLSVARPHP
jgi:hypothetical protein